MSDSVDEFGEGSFADLLEEFTISRQEDLQIGEKISGAIIAIGKDTVFVDSGTKVDAVVEKKELLDENGILPYKNGDVLDLYVVAVNENEIRLSRALSGAGGLDVLKQAYQSAVPVQGKVLATCKGGFNGQMANRRAFCPISQMDVAFTESPEDYVGQTFEFLVTQFEDKGKNIVVSRRRLLEAEIAENRKRFYAELTPGARMEGTVKRMMPYGAFVELAPGVEGMVHISELSWSHLEKVEEAVSIGQKILVEVIGIESGGPSDRKKIALSVRQAGEDPWQTVTERFLVGQRTQGKVTRLADFGAFVEIAPGIEGLVHISEMSFVRRVIKPRDVVAPGETVAVVIKDIDPERRRISLSIREAEGDPWRNVEELFSLGDKIEGVISKKEPFGYFIDLAPGVTGLAPKSSFRSSGASEWGKAKVGETITVEVVQIDMQARKISLAPVRGDEEADWERYAASTDGPMSDLGEKLQKAFAVSKKKHR